MLDKIQMKSKLEALLSGYDFTPKSQVDVMGKKVDIPVKYSDASAYMVFFSASLAKVKNLLKSNRLTPISIMGGRCLLGITFFDYRDCPVGPYHEFTFSIPVMIDSKFTVPVIPVIFDSFFPNFGYHVILMGADTDIARKHIEQIFPYPTINRNTPISLIEDGENLFASIKDGGEEIVSVSGKLPTHYKLTNKKYNTYYEGNGKLYRVKLNTFSYCSKMFGSNNLHFNFGSHEIAEMIKSLNLSLNPIMSVYYRQAIEIATEGEEI